MTDLAAMRYLVPRRLLQGAVLLLLAGGNLFGWRVLVGDLSHSRLLDTVPISDPFAVLQLLAAGGALGGNVLAGALITLALYGLLGGRMFCAWVCPLNVITDLANRGAHARMIPASTSGRATRYWILALALALSALAGTAAFETVSPIGFLHRGIVFGMGFGWLAVLAVFLWDLAVQRNGFCGRLCPLGALYAQVGRFGLLRVRHDHLACTDCMECIRVCPESQVLAQIGRSSGSILAPACTNCGRCIEVCGDEALRFDLRRRVHP